MRTKLIQYYVEGADDKKVVDTLKTKLGCIKPGKTQVLNVVTEEITQMHLRTLAPGTMVVLVFDTDAGSVEILKGNIRRLAKCKSVSEIVTIPQVPRLEAELVRSCDISKIEDLLNSKSEKDFKRDILHITNLDAKLVAHKFNIDLFWKGIAPYPYQDIQNQSVKIRMKK